MADFSEQGELFAPAAPVEGVVDINAQCKVRSECDRRVVLVAAIAVAEYAVGDHMAEAQAMVSLVERGWADQNDVARAFGCAARTVRRYQERFEAGGLAALGQPRGYPKGRRRGSQARARRIEHLKAEGHSNCEIARRLAISEKAVRKSLRRLGWKSTPAEQGMLPLAPSATDATNQSTAASGIIPATAVPNSGADPNRSAFSNTQEEPVAESFDTNPADRRRDRLLAYLGILDDAAPMFGSALAVPRAGVLLAGPALVQSGVFECAQDIYGTLGPAFYGLRTTLVVLLLMALLRIKRPEALKEHSPVALGRVLGLDRGPEVKTLRRKLDRLASVGRASEFGKALAQRRIAARGQALGFLYVDGHVRMYHGKHTIPKAHVAQRGLAAPATTDYWVNDTHGDPLFVITAEANAGMVKMLPVVLAEVRALIGPQRRLTIVFDRGGFSAKCFQQIIAAGFDLLTYRKGRFRPVTRKHFRKYKGVIAGRQLAYQLADQGVRLLKGKLRLRQVTRLTDSGHQTPILTTRRDLTALEVAFRMFERWRQENFFKYLLDEYDLDALVEYGVVPDDPTREVPNPARKALEAKVRAARAELTRLQADYGQVAFAELEGKTPTLRGLKRTQATLARSVRAAFKRVNDLVARYTRVPKRVPVQEAIREPVVRLAPERQHLTSVLKMIAYQAESDLVQMVAPHYHRTQDEGRTLIQSALASAADLDVTDHELQVRLQPLSSPHRSRAIAALCDELNRSPTVFPGSRLRLHFSIDVPP